MRLLVSTLLATSAAGFSLTASAMNVADVRAALAQHPEATWTAGVTPVVGQFGGAVPFGLPMSYRARHAMSINPSAVKTPYDLPSSYDWRNVNGKNWLSPISNQGYCGSCVAFAAVGTLEAQYNIAANAPGFDVRFSQQDLFARIGTCDEGSSPYEALSAMQSDGTPDAACAPYISGRTGADQETSYSCADVATRAVKITGYTNVDTANVKQALQSGPVLATMTVYEDLLFYTGGVYKHVSGDVAGGHAVVIVGYDDSVNAWIVRNSWGPEWGEKGYFRIDYNDVSGVGSDNYQLTVSSDNFVKIAAPTTLTAVAGTLSLHAGDPRAAGLTSVSYQISLPGTDGVHTGQFDQSMASTFDTTQLADGVYVLEGTAMNGGVASRPWYETITVANHPQTITMALTPDFDNTKAVSDRVYFKLHVDTSSVPLTHAVMTIKSADGKISTTQTYENPGPDSMVGFRTKSFPNGSYTLSVAGRIGDLQQFTGNSVTVSVAN